MIKFTTRPTFNKDASWQPSNMKVNGVRVWTKTVQHGANLHRVGRYGDKQFYSWSTDREPNYI